MVFNFVKRLQKKQRKKLLSSKYEEFINDHINEKSMKERDDISLLKFWSDKRNEFPMLVQRGVKKYHAILTSSSTVERNFKILNLQWTKNRNHLKTETACDLAFIATNLMFLNIYDETEKEKRLSRKRKANSASSSSSSAIAPAESALIQEPGSGFDDEGD